MNWTQEELNALMMKSPSMREANRALAGIPQEPVQLATAPPACAKPAPKVYGNAEKQIHENNPDPKIPRSKPQRYKVASLERAQKAEAEGQGRAIVRIVGHRVRPLDADNFSGGCKDIIDCLCEAGLIAGDAWDQIILQTDQFKVSSRTEEKTVIEIES